jgi:hypothetical protein
MSTLPSDKRLTLVTLAEAWPHTKRRWTRNSWQHDEGCAGKHYLTYIDSLGYQLCYVEHPIGGASSACVPLASVRVSPD